MSSSRHLNVDFVITEIITKMGKSSPSRMQIDVEKASYVLGRNPDSDMVFDCQDVSRKHATINIIKGEAFLVDQSTRLGNGTWVNKIPLVRRRPFSLMVGDTINLGSEHTALMVEGDTGRTRLPTQRDPKPELELDLKGREVLKNGVYIDQPLTSTEFDVLKEMYNDRGRVITYEKFWAIMNHHEPNLITGLGERMPMDKPIERQRIKQCISDIRKKIERTRPNPVIVLNSPGVGYKMPKFLGDSGGPNISICKKEEYCLGLN